MPFSTRLAGPAARLARPLSTLRARLSRDPSRETGRPGPHESAEPVVAGSAGAPGPTGPASTGPTRPRRSRPSRLQLVAVVATVAVLAGGSVAYARAHKSVTLDIDGIATTVSSFSGSIDGLLEENGVVLGEHDTVVPTGELRDGTDVVVRHAHQVAVEIDGAPETVWTTALTADEALATLSVRGDDVQLVASRSSSGRPELALELTLDGPAAVQVDGTTLTAPEGDATVAAVLDHLGVTLGDLDRVSVRHDGAGLVTVVVNRVVVQDVTTTSEVPFAQVEQKDPSLYTGRTKVTTAGVAGVRTVVEKVTTVDGVETAREPVSDEVTTAPVDQVVAVGTKARPVVTAPVAAGTPVAAGGSADSLNWAALAKCESGGNPTAVSSNGKYHGLYQFSVSTWQGVGGAGLPSQASADEQTARAKMLYNRSGAGQWPHCGPNLFG